VSLKPSVLDGGVYSDVYTELFITSARRKRQSAITTRVSSEAHIVEVMSIDPALSTLDADLSKHTFWARTFTKT